MNPDTFEYAVENTQIIRSPERRIDTFGATNFKFFLVSELMDVVGSVRVRTGDLHAERPQIITPDYLQQTLSEDFGERAGEFIGWLREHAPQLAVLKYGFRFRKTNVTESVVHSPIADVLGRLNSEIEQSENPLSAIIQGVDEGWEVSLLKFASDMIESSAPTNLGDWKRRGII
jgi:hypothetical protein